jgi:hypothetical protein
MPTTAAKGEINMTAEELLSSLKRRGFLIRVKDGQLQIVPFPKPTAKPSSALLPISCA